MRSRVFAAAAVAFAWTGLALITPVAAQPMPKVRSISPLEAKKMIEEQGNLQLVDVRTPQEFAQGALPGSRLVPYNSWYTKDFVQKMGSFDRGKPLLLVCAVGGRSFAAAGLLMKNGFSDVYNLNGGLQAWARQRVPLPEKKEPAGAAK